MNIHKRNDVSIYCLSSGPVLPEWLGDRAKRNLSKRDESIRRRIDLIQDFQMPSSSTKIVQSADGRYIFVAGTYPPRIKCFDIHDLSLKFERFMDAHVVDMVMLGEDYGKLAMLREDRTIDFHAPYGAHENIRIPAFGRGLAYEPTTCELLIAAKGNNVFRLNLEEGRFSEPWAYESESSSSCIAVAPSHPLAAVGCDDGVVRFWDNRTPDSLLKPFLQLDVRGATAGRGFADETLSYINTKEITSLAFDPNGLHMACGTAGGLATVYDIRSSRPLVIQEHKNGTAIVAIKFHSGGSILSMDEKLVKVWRYKSSRDMTSAYDNIGGSSGDGDGGIGGFNTNSDAAGSVVVNVEGSGKLTDFIMAGDEIDTDGYKSGVMLCACDQPKIESYYIPKVGLAPRWCAFLENVTEELEETDLKRKGDTDASGLVRDGNETIYENYKFVSRDDVEELGISNLIGTPMLRGYMHGFFMDINLYNRVKAVANPFAYEDYRKKKLKERLDAKRASRIAPKKDPTKKTKATVNPSLAERLEEKVKAGSDTKAGKVASKLLGDDRFGSLFTDSAFAIDEQDEDFKLRNPSGVAVSKRQNNDLDSDGEGSIDDDDEPASKPTDENGNKSGSGGESSDDDSDSDDDGLRGGKVRAEEYDDVIAPKSRREKSKKAPPKKATKKRVVYEADNLEEVANAAATRKKKLNEKNLPLAKRVAMQESNGTSEELEKVSGRLGAKEYTFVPKGARKKEEKDAKDGKDKEASQRRRGRGIKELGLKRQKM